MRHIFGLWMLLILSGCDILETAFSPVISDKEYSLDAVKLIDPTLTSDADPMTFEQGSYVVGPQRRLLLRLEKMKELSEQWAVSESNPLNVYLWTLEASDATTAQQVLSLCPLTKNWMMLATWHWAYPLDQAGQWTSPGGDYEESACVTASSADVSSGRLDFLVNSWFQDDVRGRSRNYGFVLTATAEVTLYGDQSTSYSPRVHGTQTLSSNSSASKRGF